MQLTRNRVRRRLTTWATAVLLGLTVIAPGSVANAAYPTTPRLGISVTSFDGTVIKVNFFPALGENAGSMAPTVLMGPGWGGAGLVDTQQDTGPNGGIAIKPLRNKGYNVVTWDPRGFGQSQGQAHVNDPRYEVKDVQEIIGWIAGQPGVQLESAGDPLLGMAGGSYGGSIQLAVAGIDPRVDVIAPAITYNSLETSLYRNGSFRAGMGSLLCHGGFLLGSLNNPGTGGGSLAPEVTQACNEGLSTGRLSASSVDAFLAKGPWNVAGQITVPTLILQGTVDVMFPLDEAHRNFLAVQNRGVPVKMVWFCGGHGTCNATKPTAPYRTESAVLEWFERHLKNRAVDTGPVFEYVDQHGATFSSPVYPMPQTGQLVGTKASGQLYLTSLDRVGDMSTSVPAPGSVEVPVSGGAANRQILGAATVSFTYNGGGTAADTHLYAQIVDKTAGTVIGQQTTPIPVRLDWQTRNVTVELERVAFSLGTNPNVVVQIFSRSGLYTSQKTNGVVNLSDISVTLPLVTGGA